MTTNEIRERFLNFFQSKGHKIITGDSLVPKDDATVLFTTAGMQQFKPQFLGRIDGPTRAATCQKCLRTDDLDQVGHSDVHHTFFEMLGNFSFGDYFKKDAIHWAWEFLTKELGIPMQKLWVSVYKDDEEAHHIWFNEIKVAANKIIKLGDQSNFWPSNARLNGPNGPCGPCSEIFFDYGVNPHCPKGKDCDPLCSCGRFSEVWNLVFTQFNRKDGGVLEPLPAKNIDTGMGLERLAALVQGKKSNYETDVFEPILKEVQSKIKGISQQDTKIIADHMRAVVFGISDGVMPSNEGRGYVIRKLIVDITDLAIRAGINKPVIHTLVDAVIQVMGQPYPEIVRKSSEITAIIKRIEEGFIKGRRQRVLELQECLAQVKTKATDLGQLFFLYRDTHGLTLSTIEAVALKAGISDSQLAQALKVFKAKMQEQKERSRAGSKMMGDVFADQNVALNVPKTEFLGYSQLKADATVVKIFNEAGEINQATEGQAVKIILNRTPFYAEAGGQVGDTGYLTTAQAKVRVTDTQKTNDIYIHFGTIEQGVIQAKGKVQAAIDQERRLAIMRNHTATHLLQAALREVLGSHIKQQGSLVAQDRLRFDFTHPQGIKPQEIEKIESKINGFILNDDMVTKEVLPLEEAKKKGALAFFAEKYGDTVRVVSIGNYSKEFCGGTHLDSTSQAGPFKIVSEGSVAQGIRRMEAVTGKAAVEAFLKKKQQEESAKQQSQRMKQLERQKQNSHFELIKSSVDELIRGAENVKGISVITRCLEGADIALLRKLSDLLKKKLPSGVFILGAKSKQDASLIVSVTDDLVTKGIKANELVDQIALLIDGSGGGRANMAQAGGKGVDKLDTALAKAKKIIEASLPGV
ncbi:MAG: alanine--tRNA ligase [Candidatus Omnitrophica bacterium]|nr:alanine--tRNA ligase [Candidatus Omnitrophota bacterium]